MKRLLDSIKNRNNRAPLLAGGILVVIGILNTLMLNSSNLMIDDAYIFFRYVDNWIGGHGLTWNPGEVGSDRVEGYTSFLYVVLLAIPRVVGADLVLLADLLNLGFFFGATMLALWLVIRAFGGWRPATVVAPLLLVTSAALAEAARGGMELMLFAFLVVLAGALHLHVPERPRLRFVSGMVFGLVILTRPEGALIYGVCALASLRTTWKEGLAVAIKKEVWRLGGLVALVLPHLIWRIAYYGELLPNTFHAKVGFSFANVARGLEGFLHFLGTFGGVVVSLALVGWAIAPRTGGDRDRLGNLWASFLLVWLGYAGIFLGLPDWRATYTVPIVLFSLLTLGWAATSMLSSVPVFEGRSRGARAAVAITFALFVLGNLEPAITRNLESGKGFRVSLSDPPDGSMICDFIAIGKKLKELSDPEDTVAVGACGAIPYFSELTTYDTLGLNDKHIARQEVRDPGAAPFGHEKGDGSYIISKSPTFLIPFPMATDKPTKGYVGFSVTFREINKNAEFRHGYEFKAVQLEDGRYFNYFQRKRR